MQHTSTRESVCREAAAAAPTGALADAAIRRRFLIVPATCSTSLLLAPFSLCTSDNHGLVMIVIRLFVSSCDCVSMSENVCCNARCSLQLVAVVVSCWWILIR